MKRRIFLKFTECTHFLHMKKHSYHILLKLRFNRIPIFNSVRCSTMNNSRFTIIQLPIRRAVRRVLEPSFYVSSFDQHIPLSSDHVFIALTPWQINSTFKEDNLHSVHQSIGIHNIMFHNTRSISWTSTWKKTTIELRNDGWLVDGWRWVYSVVMHRVRRILHFVYHARDTHSHVLYGSRSIQAWWRRVKWNVRCWVAFNSCGCYGSCGSIWSESLHAQFRSLHVQCGHY